MEVQIWFWQAMVSPHMAPLAEAIARLGLPVTYIAEAPLSADRAEQGWLAPSLQHAHLRIVSDTASAIALARAAPESVIHVCQGLRGNGYISSVQAALADRRAQQWVVMETVDDRGLAGVVRRVRYWSILQTSASRITGILAIGHATREWLIARGFPGDRVHPFAYFLPELEFRKNVRPAGRFRFLYVGQLIKRKRVRELMAELSCVTGDFELLVVGRGKEEDRLRGAAQRLLPGRVRWTGPVPMPQVAPLLAAADCLVLPSAHDGWGAVASEALLSGTPVICSDRCGVAGLVRASGHGGVFHTSDAPALRRLLQATLQAGPLGLQESELLAQWAKRVAAPEGAGYTIGLLCPTATSTRCPSRAADTYAALTQTI